MSYLADPPGVAGDRPRRPWSWRSPSWRAWPLRTRLIVPAVLVLTAVCAVIVSASALILRLNVDGEVQAQLETTQSHLQGPHGLGDPGADSSSLSNLLTNVPGVHDGTLVALVGQDGTVRQAAVSSISDTTGNNQVNPLTSTQSSVLTGAQDWHSARQVHIEGVGDYLVEFVPAPPGADSSNETLVVGVSMGNAESTVDSMIVAMAVTSFAGIVGAVLLFSWITRLALRPLDRVAATATRVSQIPLHRGEVGELERVPDQDTDDRTEVGQVGAALNVLLDHVGGALAARHTSEMRVRQFVADASHELRTPLASIRGYAELTRRGGEQIPPDTAYALQRVESEAERMARLVEDLLLLARLDSGRPLDRAEVDLIPLVIDTVRDAHAAGLRHDWSIDLPGEEDEQPVVVGDPHRLQQVLVNLLANARTHTPPGTTVTTSVHVEAGHCVLRVMDNGPGIPPDLLPRVFERFARGDASRSRAAGSTGLGLAIVSAVVASHGGSVDVDSIPGRTVFTVRIPAQSQPVGARGTARPAIR